MLLNLILDVETLIWRFEFEIVWLGFVVWPCDLLGRVFDFCYGRLSIFRFGMDFQLILSEAMMMICDEFEIVWFEM